MFIIVDASTYYYYRKDASLISNLTSKYFTNKLVEDELLLIKDAIINVIYIYLLPVVIF